MESATRYQSIAVKTETVEDIINAEMSRFLRGCGILPEKYEVSVKLPSVGDTFMLPIELRKEFIEERLVLHIL